MSLKKTTKKRLLIVMSLCALLVGGALGLYAVRKQRIHAQFMAWRAEGMQAAKQSENNKAVDLLGRYLRRYPEDVDVLVEYVRVRPLVKSPERQHLRDTMTVLRHLLTLRPDMYEQRKALLKLYGDYGYASEVVVTADKLLESNPTDPEVVGIRATALARVRRLPDALAAAQSWATLAPQDIDAHLLCLDMMQANGWSSAQVTDAADGLKGKLKDPASFELVRGIAAAVSGESDPKSWILKAASHSGTELKVRRRIIATLDRFGEQEKSLELLKTLVKETGDPDSQKTLVKRLWERQAFPDVLAFPIAANSELAADLELKGMFGASLARTGKVDEARKIAAELVAAKQDATGMAWGEMLSQGLTPQTADPRRLVDACQAGLKDSPGDAYLRYFLGQAYGRMGELDLASSSYRIAAQQDNTWAAPLVALAESYSSLDRQEQALDAAIAAVNRSRTIAPALILAQTLNANIQSGRRSDDEALRQVLDSVEASPGAGQFVLPERVAWMARAREIDKAIAAVKDALTAPTALDENVLKRLAVVCRVYKLSVEQDCYAALEKRSGASPSLAFSKSVSTLLGGKTADALAQFREARTQSAKGDDLQWQIAETRLMDLARDPKAGSEWVKLGDAHPNDLVVQGMLLSARAPRNDRDFMARTIERVKQLSSDEGVQWRIAKARWLLDDPANGKAEAEAASVLLTEALRSAPDSIDGRVLQARALERQGNGSAAADQLTTVLRLNPTMSNAALYLAKLLQARGDFSGAREYLDRVTRSGLKDDISRRFAAQLLAQQGAPEQAIKLLEEAADIDGGSDYLLAMLYRDRNDLVHAEALCAKLLQKPDLQSIALAMDVYRALGRQDDVKRAAALLKTINVEPGIEELLLAENAGRSGKAEEAMQLSKLASLKAPKNASTWKALFAFTLACGKPAEAWAAVEQGLKLVPNDSYLIAISDAKPQIVAGLANSSLLPLALSLVRNPETGGTREALQVMMIPVSVENSREQQIGRLQQIANQYPLNLGVQLFTIAQLLAEGNRNDEAATLATRATQSFPSSADAARMAARALMNGKRWNDAHAFAKVWRERTLNNPGEADLLAASALMKADQPAAAKEALAPYIAKAKEAPEQNAELVTLYVAALLRSGATSEAEGLLLPMLQRSERMRSAWLARGSEDLSIIDQVKWTERIGQMTSDNSLATQLQLAGASSAAGQQSGNEALLATARQMRSELISRKDLPAPAMAILASQADQDKDFVNAEALYRRALAADPNLVVIKNNLAMLLARNGGDLAEATRLANEAVQAAPSVPNFYDTLATVQVKAGKIDQGAETLRIAARIDPGHLEWLINLADLFASADRKTDAKKVIDEINVNPRKVQLSEELKSKLKAVEAKLIAGAAAPARAGNP